MRKPYMFLLMFSAIFSSHSYGEDKNRGRLLYENHCTECHESTIHIRQKSKVKKRADIDYWMKRWANVLSLKWTNDEYDDVRLYLDQTFYHFDKKKDNKK